MKSNQTLCVELWPNGKLKSLGVIESGQINGHVQGFRTTGAPDYLQHFSSGISNGPYQFYFSNGQLEEVGTFRDGNNYGITEQFSEDGGLRRKSIHRRPGLGGLWPIKHEGGVLTVRKSSFELSYGSQTTHPHANHWQ